jgi:hypothetical protein
MHSKPLSENLNIRDYFRDRGTDGRITLEWITFAPSIFVINSMKAKFFTKQKFVTLQIVTHCHIVLYYTTE